MYFDACIDGVGAVLEQGRLDGSMRPVVYISRATVASEVHLTPLDVEAGSIAWSIKRLRGYLWGTKFRIFWDHKPLKSISKFGDQNARVQRWFDRFTALDYIPEYRKGRANGKADFLSHSSGPATKHDRTGSSSPILVEDGGIFLIGACGFRTRASPIPGFWFEWAGSPPRERCLGWAPFCLFGFAYFRTRGPCMGIDDLSAPSVIFLVRVTAAVTTDDCHPDRE